MKFQLIVEFYLIFYLRFCELQKASGITHEKMLLATALALLIYRICSTDVYCSKQTSSGSTKETITHHFFVSGIGQKKTVDAAKICLAAQKMLLKQKPSKHFVNGLLGFNIQAFILRWRLSCVMLTIIAPLPSI